MAEAKELTIITRAETLIRQKTLNGYLTDKSKDTIQKEVKEIIKQAIKEITNQTLRNATRRSLSRFFLDYCKELQKVLTTDMKRLSVFYYSLDKEDERRKTIDREMYKLGYDTSKNLGVPKHMYSKKYTKELVKPLIDKLATEHCIDPDDLSGRNSLRNRAEMEIRYQGHQDNIDELKSKGCKLVVASSHADCSERCSQWQGRVFSLDGTSGTTDDGRKYIPLETATDIFYTTKKGKRYKNGLLGFNCRHYLIAYKKNEKFLNPAPVVQKRERNITATQRAYERAIRGQRVKVMTAKELDKDEYLVEKSRLKELDKKYKEFCLTNARAIETDRTKII